MTSQYVGSFSINPLGKTKKMWVILRALLPHSKTWRNQTMRGNETNFTKERLGIKLSSLLAQAFYRQVMECELSLSPLSHVSRFKSLHQYANSPNGFIDEHDNTIEPPHPRRVLHRIGTPPHCRILVSSLFRRRP